jgi:uncharacterized protein YoxC
MKQIAHAVASIATLLICPACYSQTLADLVCADMIAKFSEGKGTNIYGAYFVASLEQKAGILKLLTYSIPRLEVGTNNLVQTQKGLFDQITKKPAAIFSAKIKSISATEATVSAFWASGPEAAAGYEYRLTNTVAKTNWIIVSRALKHIS